MGYGEFGGTGSVKWLVKHGDKSKKISFDKDTEPKLEDGGYFILAIKAAISKSEAQKAVTFLNNGTVKVRVKIEDVPRQIQIWWPPDPPEV